MFPKARPKAGSRTSRSLTWQVQLNRIKCPDRVSRCNLVSSDWILTVNGQGWSHSTERISTNEERERTSSLIIFHLDHEIGRDGLDLFPKSVAVQTGGND